MATTTPNFGWAVPTSSDLVKNGATAIETLGDSIDASLVDLKGGTTGQVLAKATNTDMDFTWTTVGGGGGKVLQVVSATTSTTTSTTSTTYGNTNLTASITPSASTSKVLIMMTVPEVYKSGTSGNSVGMRITRGGTAVNQFANSTNVTNTTNDCFITISAQYLDSPATTSSTTYTLQIRSNSAGSQVGVIDASSSAASIILMEIGA